MENAESYDIRGRQAGILRLYSFDKEGLIHMVFYRIAVFLALILAASIMIGIVYYSNPFTKITKILILLIWILFTPQIFETGKATAIIMSRGVVFGRLNKSFLKYGAKRERVYVIYSLLPYIIVLIWALGFIEMLALWF